jgi:hypothetical protein
LKPLELAQFCLIRRLSACAKSAQKSANPEQTGQTHCQPTAHVRLMARIIPIKFRRSRLPRRLLNDGWWLEAPPARGAVVAFPKRTNAPGSGAVTNRRIRHLTLITTPGK